MTDSVGPGKLVRHTSYTYDEYLICIGLGPSISSVICKNTSYSDPSYPSSPVFSCILSFSNHILSFCFICFLLDDHSRKVMGGKVLSQVLKSNPGHDVNFCSDLPHRASEIQFSLALPQLSLAHTIVCFIIFHLKPSRTWFWHVKAYFLGQAWMPGHETSHK